MSMPAGARDTRSIEADLLRAGRSLAGNADASVNEHRRRAAACFAATGLPTTRDENWKYTDISRMDALLGARIREAESPLPVDASAIDAAAIPGLDAYRIVFVDGHCYRDMSVLPEGVWITTLAELLESDPEQALKSLGFDEQAPLFNGFVALNAAMAADGVCVCVGDGVSLNKPLHMLHVASRGGRVAHIRHGLMLGQASEAVIIEHFSGAPHAGEDGGAGLTSVVTNIHLHENARLTHYRLQQEAARQFHIGRVDVVQERDSRYVSHCVALGAALSRADIVVRLGGTGAFCDLNGLYLAGGRQHIDHHTHIDHAAPRGTSREYYRGVLDGRSRAVFNGKVVVCEGAEKTDAVQSNANLLLSGHAEIDTKPELEIYADDVKCAHGATVGQLDAEALFYLRSRGVGEETARDLLTYAFADEVIRRMDLDVIRRGLEKTILGQLPAGAGIRELT